MSLKPTPEQEAIMDAAGNHTTSMMITAYAGTGKTTTLVMLANTLRCSSALAIAFNKKIAQELEKRFPPHFQTMTLNGLGHRAWMRAIGKKITLDDRKLGKLVTAVCKREGFEATTDQWSAIRELVSNAMMSGLVPNVFPNQGLLPDTPEQWEVLAEEAWTDSTSAMRDIARVCLIESIQQSFQGIISFDDQIYMSTMFNGVFPRFPVVMVDEAQDLSVLNHIQIKRCAGPDGRLIVVGDPKQAIYAFRGADSSSMGKLRKLRPEWIDLPLATTFRCPKIVVGRQQDHAPGYVAFDANIEGEFTRLPNKPQVPKADAELPTWSPGDIDAEFGQVAILCRNNAPLLGMAFKLIRAGIPALMMGRDIGKGLIALSNKILPLDDIPTLECIRLVRDWASGEIALARANDKEHKVSGIEDRAECLVAVLESGGAKNSGDLRQKLDALFSRDTGKVTLATGHRAKGLEWDTVVHLDPWRIPSRYAQANPSQMEQELNLRYVIETRSKRKLIEANLEDFAI